MRLGRTLGPGLLGLVLLVSACAGPSAPSFAPGGATTSPRPSAPKILRMAIQNETNSFVSTIAGTSTTTGGQHQPDEIVHNWLTATDSDNRTVPSLAAEIPSLEQGTWKVNPDGAMELTWKLRQNVTWHDGAPFTADDVVFGWQAANDPAIQGSNEVKMISAVEAPDPFTVIMQWRQVWVTADQLNRTTLDPLPRHLLAEAFAGDKEAFVNSSFWTTGFVGLGPFKIVRWEPGSHMELTRHDQYYRGPARLDGMVIRFMPDPNAMVAAILAEDLDVVMPISIDVEQARTLRDRWTGTGNQVLIGLPDLLRFTSPQFRPEVQSEPALLDPQVRRALYQAIDRQAVSDLVTQGFGFPADSFVSPNDPYRQDVEHAIPQYPYDLAAAAQTLAQAGWTKGGDGVLRNAQGRAFQTSIQVTSQGRAEKELNSISDGWKQLGVQVEQKILPASITRDREAWTSFPGFDIRATSGQAFYLNRLHSSTSVTPQNRFTGSNAASYQNPEVDRLYDRLVVTIPRPERVNLTRDLARAVMTDIGFMPLYWDPETIEALARVKNLPRPSARGQIHTWNAYEWDLER